MKHLGDISKINGAAIEPVDVISFGSPCQDLSVAGKRAGLEGARSGLFMEAVRIIKEMREATDGKYPRFALWENVPGAFSSNKGEDFRVVLEELIKIVEPTAVMPAVPKKGWAYADSHVGDGWSIAYRVLDTQYWPRTPQRRRRIYLVADFGGQCAGEILFKSDGLHGHFAKSGAPWEGVAAYAENGAGAADRTAWGLTTKGNGDAFISEERHTALSTGGGQAGQGYPAAVIATATQQGGAEVSENGICPTITAAAGMSGNNQPWVVYNGENITNPLNKANPKPGDPCHTLGTDSRNYLVQVYGISSYDSNAMKSSNPHSGIYEAETSRTLDLNGGNPACNQGGIAIVQQTCLIDSIGGQAERGWEGDIAPTLKASHFKCPPVITVHGEEISGKLLSRDYKGAGRWDSLDKVVCCSNEEMPIALDRAFYNQGQHALYDPQYYTDGTVPTLVARGPAAVCEKYIVRRLTPTECARLQGFPDKWGHPDQKESFSDEENEFWLEVRNTHAAINGKAVKEYSKTQMEKWYNKLHSDSAEYKMWGNGIALPTALYVMQGIAATKEEREANNDRMAEKSSDPIQSRGEQVGNRPTAPE